MTTKAPSAVREFAPDTLEKIAYTSVADIPTQEPNDRNRLGYHIWRWLTNRQGSLEDAVAESSARLLVSQKEAVRIIREALIRQGTPIP